MSRYDIVLLRKFLKIVERKYLSSSFRHNDFEAIRIRRITFTIYTNYYYTLYRIVKNFDV